MRYMSRVRRSRRRRTCRHRAIDEWAARWIGEGPHLGTATGARRRHDRSPAPWLDRMHDPLAGYAKAEWIAGFDILECATAG